MHNFVLALQIITALGAIILMAVQTEKSEQSGGVMGLGGRMSSETDVAVGPERILKPLTKWVMVAFLFCSILSAEPAGKINIVHFLIALAIYVVAMLFGDTIWAGLTGRR